MFSGPSCSSFSFFVFLVCVYKYTHTHAHSHIMACLCLLCARGVIGKSRQDNHPQTYLQQFNWTSQPSQASPSPWLGDMKLSLLSLSFCSILSSHRLPLTPLSFVPPGSWCVLSGGMDGMGGWGDDRGRAGSALLPPGSFWCSFSSAVSRGHFGFLIADDNYHHHYCYLHQRVGLLEPCVRRSFINPAAAIWLILEFLTFNVLLILLFFARCQSVTGFEQRAVNRGVGGHRGARQSPGIRRCPPVLSPSQAQAAMCLCPCTHARTHTTGGMYLLTTYYNGHIHPTEMKKWIPRSS